MHISKCRLGKWLAGICLAGLAVYFGWRFFQPTPAVKKEPLPIPSLPSISHSPYRNVSGEAEYVGRETCAECHAEIHDDYQFTAHANALSPVDLSEEPEPGEFSTKDGRRYRIEHRGDQSWHRESFRTADGKDQVLAEHPMQWVIGSGRFSKSYLAEIDGFLVQSPATWYRSRPGWALSPGYERYNSGFERTVELRCILCHVGRAEPKEGSFHRLTIHTQAIDCERCHGPGSLHVAERKQTASPTGDDFSIVHPGRLDRQRSEAICAQCHLHSAAMVDLRGRQLSEFRPGLPLTDFAIPYGLESSNQEMQVVGHMEQMQLSRCYQESKTLTCITCHNPHKTVEPPKQVAHYRKTCLECHEESSCGLEVAERLKSHADDSCIACHMPESPTDIPHFAFTHHRIAVHRPEDAASNASAPQTLIPLADVSHLPQIDQDRNLGLAYLQAGDHPEHLQHGPHYREEARRLLEEVHDRGLRDPAVNAALARLYWQTNEERTIEFAKAVLEDPSALPEDRATALFTLATTYVRRDKLPEAVPLLEELVRSRYYSDAWHLLSLGREDRGDLEGAIAAAQKAGEISPLRPDFQQHLAELFRKAQRSDKAAKHWQQMQQLRSYHQQRQ